MVPNEGDAVDRTLHALLAPREVREVLPFDRDPEASYRSGGKNQVR
jgi:hypothetical protein